MSELDAEERKRAGAAGTSSEERGREGQMEGGRVMSDRKPRPLWPLLTAALIGLPVLYVASFGPACWLLGRDLCDTRLITVGYAPILSVYSNGPMSIRKGIWWYCECCDAEYGFHLALLCSYPIQQRRDIP